MTKAASRTRAIQTPGEPVKAVALADETVTEAVEAEQHQAEAAEADPAGELEAAQALADETKRPVLTREGWVMPNVPVLPNLNRF